MLGCRGRQLRERHGGLVVLGRLLEVALVLAAVEVGPALALVRQKVPAERAAELGPILCRGALYRARGVSSLILRFVGWDGMGLRKTGACRPPVIVVPAQPGSALPPRACRP